MLLKYPAGHVGNLGKIGNVNLVTFNRINKLCKYGWERYSRLIMNNFRHLCVPVAFSWTCMTGVFIPNTDQKINNRRDFRHPSPSVMINNHYKHFRMIPWFAPFSVVIKSGRKFQSALTSINLLWLFSVRIIIF